MANNLRDAKKMKEREAKIEASIWGLCLGEVQTVFEDEIKDNSGKTVRLVERRYERVPGGWIHHYVYRQLMGENGFQVEHTSTFIPYVERDKWRD